MNIPAEIPATVPTEPALKKTTEPDPAPASLDEHKFRASVDLTNRVLGIITLIACLLIAYLAFMEIEFEDSAIFETLTVAKMGQADGAPGPEKIEALLDALEQSENSGSGATLPADAGETIARLRAFSGNARERDVLDQCISAMRLAPGDAGRQADVKACKFALDQSAAERRKQDSARLDQAISFRKLDLEQREQFHHFWLSAAQTLLLNLMLPVATALLGYAFGTHQLGFGKGKS